MTALPIAGEGRFLSVVKKGIRSLYGCTFWISLPHHLVNHTKKFPSVLLIKIGVVSEKI